MPRHLPSLRALTSFEAAARTGSLSQAARELNVTHGAISRAVRMLERELGRPLLQRSGNGVVATDAGERLAREVATAWARVRSAWESLGQSAHGDTVTVTLSTSLALKWLVPRLSAFQSRVPDVTLRLVTDDRVLDLARHGIDGALRFGTGPWTECQLRFSVAERLVPVAAPSLLEQAGAAPDDMDLEAVLRLPLLNDEVHPGWDAWAKQARLPPPPAGGRGQFQDTAVLIGAAISGRGAALVRHLLANDDLEAGRLVPLPGPRVGLAGHLSVLVAPGPVSPAWQAFETWLRKELRAAGGR